jgi:hypothetical protein
MTDNVLNFPCSWQKDGGVYHGGKFYPDIDAMAAALSDKDWARMTEWERRRLAWRRHKQGGASCSGGVSAA